MQPLPVVVFPDAEQLVIDYLAGVLGSGVAVGAELPEDVQAAVPVVAVSLLDTDEVLDFVLEDPVLDVEVLAADKASASDLARLVSAHMKVLPSIPVSGAQVYEVERQGLAWLPDDVTDLPRYVLTFRLRVRPA
ncbi:hypothetical protein OG216_09625 [Streptomycetaceae bacterium NBC_01309]